MKNLTTKGMDSIIENYRKTEISRRVSVKIPSDEVDKLVVKSLIKIRNSSGNKNSDMSHFDKVIRHYLSESEFEKYVINGKKIKQK